MKNFILGVVLTLAVSSWAATQNPDGSVLIDKDELEQLRVNWYQMNSNFNLCVQQVGELRQKLDVLEKAKCT